MSDDTTRIGAHPNDRGCSFRVWAPHATALTVLIQNGNSWDANETPDRAPLAGPDDGYWSGTAPNVGPGQLYRYEITTDGGTFQRLDPAARDLLHSGLTRHNPGSENASIVVSDEPYDWTEFDTPRFKDFLIY